MMPWHHAVSSAKKHGGKPEDYLPVHNWFDATKAHYADFRHRALRHHSAGIFECEAEFGPCITNSNGKQIPVRIIGEQHVMEDCGFIPTVADWLRHITPQPWMRRVAVKSTDIGDIPAGNSDGQEATINTAGKHDHAGVYHQPQRHAGVPQHRICGRVPAAENTAAE